MEEFVYNGIVNNIAQEFARAMEGIQAVFNFDYGDEFEIAVCKFLRRFLPLKYGICRGFVVDKVGNTAGDDIIIFNQELYPTLRFLGTDKQFAQKEQIPVEAVYAYIEAKHTLDSNTLKKAVKQVGEVKRLCYSRDAVYKINVEKDYPIFDNKFSKSNGWNPIITNPVYGMILALNCVGTNGKKSENGADISDFLLEEIQNKLISDIKELRHYSFDSLIAGKTNTTFCGHYMFDKSGHKKDGILITRFYTGLSPSSCYQVNVHENMAFGLAVCHLMLALNYIKLGNMPWEMIFNTAKMPNKSERERFMEIIEEN